MIILSIIILSYNTKELTRRCIESLVQQYKEELENGEIEIIVVDNGSKDGTIEILKSIRLAQDPEFIEGQVQNDKRDSGSSTRMTRKITIIQNEKNLGFAKGCNIGSKKSKGKYILFLNSDTETLDRGFLKMTEFLDANSTIGILGGKLLNPDSSPQPSAGKFYTLFNLFLMLTGMEVFLGIRKSPNTISKVDWVSGGCMMVKKSLFEKLSGFDENFFMYIEDMEMCFRANKLGSATYFYPDVKVLHKELGSSSRSFAIINIYKGILHFYAKHKNYFQYVTAKAMLIVKAKIATVIGIITGNSSLINTYSEAIKF